MADDIRAQANYIPFSPQKVRLVIDLVRGKDITEALDMLRFVQNKAALPVSKVLSSAMSNAEENFGVSRDDLYVHKIHADGRFKPIIRRASHITVVLREREY
jgi:large subunit ribosomal protein L22